MNDRTFDRPVFVRKGEFMVEEIECLADAFEFLQEWPNNRRGPIFDTAFRACQRAYDGQVPFPLHARLSPASRDRPKYSRTPLQLCPG